MVGSVPGAEPRYGSGVRYDSGPGVGVESGSGSGAKSIAGSGVERIAGSRDSGLGPQDMSVSDWHDGHRSHVPSAEYSHEPA